MFTRLLETLRQYQPSVTKQASLLKDLILSRFHEKTGPEVFFNSPIKVVTDAGSDLGGPVFFHTPK